MFYVVNATVFRVSNMAEYNEKVKTLEAGDSIILSKGVWKDAQFVFYGEGTKDKPITLTVEKYGETTIEGLSTLNMHGSYLIVDGLVFVNGYSPTNRVIETRKGTKLLANYSIIRNCVIDNFNKPNRASEDAWVNLWGQQNTVEYCYFGGKTNHGVTLIIWPNGEGNNENFHHIYRNYFGPRPRLGSNGGETMRIGTSHVSMQNSNTIVEGNYFEHCNGEVEIVSVKSCENRIINNTFFECEGGVVLRHGDRNEVSGNYFLGNMKPFTGGVRIINNGQKVFNNYFYGLRGKDFRGSLVVMNGVPNSPANRYHQVKDALITFNTWVDCELPWQLCVGSDEERTLTPINTIISNNIIYGPQEPLLIKAFDKLDGIQFEDNILISARGNEVDDGFIEAKVRAGRGVNGLPLIFTEAKATSDMGVKTDIDGRIRADQKWIGAIEMSGGAQPIIERASKSNTGPSWYNPIKVNTQVESLKIIKVIPGKDELLKAVRKSKPGETLVLESGEYMNSRKIVIPHSLSIIAEEGALTRPIIKIEDETSTTAVTMFEIGSDLTFKIDGLTLDGGAKQKKPVKYAFATVKESIHSYNMYINNCEFFDFKVSNGGCVYKAYKNSFADTLSVTNTYIHDCFRGFALNDEKDEKGLYNAEFITFQNTILKNIEQWAIDFLRGGNDESTLGGNLIISHCVFDNVNNKENQWIIKQTGLIGIEIENSIFVNSPLVKGPIRLLGRHNTISYSNVYKAGKVSISKSAILGEGMMYVDPKFEKNTLYRLSSNSALRGKSSNGENIGLK